jgi:predicted nucleic acid-binding protein
MNVFLDTNAVVKLYHQEAGTDNLTNFLSLHQRDLIITISDLTRIELHSTFMKRVRMKQIDFDAAHEVLAAFDHDAQMFNIWEVDGEVKGHATGLLKNVAHKKSLRTLDAIQLATALVSDQIIPVDYFVTSDKKLLKVSGDYFLNFNPEELKP